MRGRSDRGEGVGLVQVSIPRKKELLPGGLGMSVVEEGRAGTDSGLANVGPWAPSEAGLKRFPSASFPFLFFFFVLFLFSFSDFHFFFSDFYFYFLSFANQFK
jgi:hypothetical protein